MLRGEQARMEMLQDKYRAVFEKMTELGVVISEQRMMAARLYVHGVTHQQANKEWVRETARSVDQEYEAELLLALEQFPVTAPPERPPDPVYSSSAPTDYPPAPAPKSLARLTYVVQPHDTLAKLAQLFYGDASQANRIYEANTDILPNEAEPLYPGQSLTIP